MLDFIAQAFGFGEAMDTAHLIAQIFGLGATLTCLLLPLFKKKWQMLVATIACNVCMALNLVLLGQLGSAFYINVIAVVQPVLSLWHTLRNVPVTKTETVVFGALYLVCGVVGFTGPLDLLPIVGSMFNMLATFQRDEQKTRMLILCNATSYAVYFAIIGSTSIFAELCAITTCIIGLIRYRKTRSA